MTDAIHFPLYVLRQLDTANLVSEASQRQPRLALFTTAELASDYGKSAGNFRVIRLTEPDQLRQVLAEYREEVPDFAIVMDPGTCLTS